MVSEVFETTSRYVPGAPLVMPFEVTHILQQHEGRAALFDHAEYFVEEGAVGGILEACLPPGFGRTVGRESRRIVCREAALAQRCP